MRWETDDERTDVLPFGTYLNYSFFWLICTTRNGVSIFSTCELRERMESVSIEAM